MSQPRQQPALLGWSGESGIPCPQLCHRMECAALGCSRSPAKAGGRVAGSWGLGESSWHKAASVLVWGCWEGSRPGSQGTTCRAAMLIPRLPLRGPHKHLRHARHTGSPGCSTASLQGQGPVDTPYLSQILRTPERTRSSMAAKGSPKTVQHTIQPEGPTELYIQPGHENGRQLSRTWRPRPAPALRIQQG